MSISLLSPSAKDLPATKPAGAGAQPLPAAGGHSGLSSPSQVNSPAALPSSSMAAEAAIHERRKNENAQLLQINATTPLFPKKGNPTLQISPLFYEPGTQTGWVYIMASKPNGILYVGQTTNLPLRAHQHREGLIPGFTKKYGCKTLVYFEGFQLIAESITRETQMKNWSRAWKIRRILATNPQWRDLYPEIAA